MGTRAKCHSIWWIFMKLLESLTSLSATPMFMLFPYLGIYPNTKTIVSWSFHLMFQKQLSTEDEKSKKLKITEKHLKIAKEERRVSSSSQLSKVVSESTDSGMNRVQLAFNSDSGHRVPCYDYTFSLTSKQCSLCCSCFFQTLSSVLRLLNTATSNKYV